MKALVVDDTEKDRERFVGLAKKLADNVITAINVTSGIEIALEERPDLIITDHDLPDGTGNDVAKAVKESYDPRVIGVTGGDDKSFDEQYVDLTFSKTVSDDFFTKRVEGFLSGSEEFNTGESLKLVAKVIDDYAALSVLVQGYEISAKLRRGEPVLEHQKLRVPTEQEQIDLFNFDNIGLDVSKLIVGSNRIIDDVLDYIPKGELSEVLYEFTQDDKMQAFFIKLLENDIESIDESEAAKFNELYFRLCDAYQKEMR